MSYDTIASLQRNATIRASTKLQLEKRLVLKKNL